MDGRYMVVGVVQWVNFFFPSLGLRPSEYKYLPWHSRQHWSHSSTANLSQFFWSIHEKLHPPLRLMGFNLDIYCVSLIISVKWTRWTGRDGFQQVFCLILTPIKSSYYQNLKCIKDWTHRSPCDSLHSYCSGTCFIRSTEDADLGVILHLNDMGYLPKGAN